MMELQETLALLAIILGVGWASGINLYATIVVLGMAGNSGLLDLPAALDVLQHPLVLMAAGFMYLTEFCVDKIPGVDSAWDALHTFIRIPAGAILGAAMVSEVSPELVLAAALVAGTLSASTHAAKASSRLMINTSPEPFSNVVASLGEDALVFAGLWLALLYPAAFFLFLLAFTALLIWLLPKLWRLIDGLFARLANWIEKRYGTRDQTEAPQLPPPF